MDSVFLIVVFGRVWRIVEDLVGGSFFRLFHETVMDPHVTFSPTKPAPDVISNARLKVSATVNVHETAAVPALANVPDPTST